MDVVLHGSIAKRVGAGGIVREHAAEFARFARLHDQLRGEQLAIMLLPEAVAAPRRNWRTWTSMVRLSPRKV